MKDMKSGDVSFFYFYFPPQPHVVYGTVYGIRRKAQGHIRKRGMIFQRHFVHPLLGVRCID